MEEKKNLFHCLNLPVQFDLDSEKLEEKYFLAIAKSHPDQLLSNRNIASNNDDRNNQTQSSISASLVNQAYQTLSQPLKRAKYLLQLKGIEVSENINNHSNSDFLMEKMSLYEKLDSIKATEGDNQEQLNQFKAELNQQLNNHYAHFQKLFDSNQLDEVVEKITCCQFFDQILQKAEDLSSDCKNNSSADSVENKISH